MIESEIMTLIGTVMLGIASGLFAYLIRETIRKEFRKFPTFLVVIIVTLLIAGMGIIYYSWGVEERYVNKVEPIFVNILSDQVKIGESMDKYIGGKLTGGKLTGTEFVEIAKQCRKNFTVFYDDVNMITPPKKLASAHTSILLGTKVMINCTKSIEEGICEGNMTKAIDQSGIEYDAALLFFTRAQGDLDRYRYG